MDKISKLEMFYNLANAHDIRVVVNTGTSSSNPIPTLVLNHISTIKTLALAPEADHLADVIANLTRGSMFAFGFKGDDPGGRTIISSEISFFKDDSGC